ncbi:hypothetical protein H7J87_27080 [Mycolicibacterium wolinskyi]|uniref:Uncharacterized protein n=1 Tax=Mycolicibacterium wolinskyi TaxID=59750 RepID=A0A1X2F4P8_9MYCO|nr:MULTISPECIES: hypothetical protein [Mycolicibacterium]MCV7288997.1 hypothetical protein [Mycolicibacterium wolinskyi]MCV7296424.1 hypothetical protein [Mycolicibacterium goodii]ORX13358.1 hypothetical protein AWC31_02225 [Mycolicibacterium wolinskyi]
MNKLIVGALAAGALGGAIAFAAPASAAPDCSKVIKDINEKDHTPTSTEAWTCAVQIQANAWEQFPSQLREDWQNYPTKLENSWKSFPGELEKNWREFPDKLRDGWTPGDESPEAADAPE